MRAEITMLAKGVLALALCTGGCGRVGFDYVEVSPDGGSGSGGVDGGADAGMDAGDAGAPDAGAADAGDAGATDGGADMGASDADAGGGPTPTCPIGAVGCSSFEVGETFATSATTGTSVATSTSEAYDGEQALLISTAGGGSRGWAEFPLPALIAPFYFRGHYLLPATADLEGAELFSFGSEGSLDRVSIRVGSGRTMDTWIGSEDMLHPGSPVARVPLGEWFCLQVVLSPAGDGGQLTWSLNQANPFTLSGVNVDPAADPWAYGVGMGWTDASQQAIDMFVDAVAVSESPLPCLPLP